MNIIDLPEDMLDNIFRIIEDENIYFDAYKVIYGAAYKKHNND